MLKANATLAALLLLAVLLSLAATAALSGHSGIMHSAQLQLGLLYFGLFGAILLVLYLHVSARTALPPHVGVAVAFTAVFAVLVLWYRRSRYVDTETIRSEDAEDCSDGSRAARALGRFGKILNGCLSVLLVLLVIVVLMDLRAADAAALARESAAALASGTRVPGVALLALCLLPLSYPLVDVTNWLRLAASRKDVGVESEDSAAALRGFFAGVRTGDDAGRPSRLGVWRDRGRRVRATGDDGRRGGLRCPARVARQPGRRHRLGAVRDLRPCGDAVDDERAAGRRALHAPL
jgi:hypothetical protein